MMLQTHKKITAMQIFPNITRSKDNQSMKFSQLIEYNLRNSYKSHIKNDAGKLDSYLLLFFQKL